MWLWLVPLGQSGNTKYALDAYCFLVTLILLHCQPQIAVFCMGTPYIHTHTHTHVALTMGKNNRPSKLANNSTKFPSVDARSGDQFNDCRVEERTKSNAPWSQTFFGFSLVCTQNLKNNKVYQMSKWKVYDLHTYIHTYTYMHFHNPW